MIYFMDAGGGGSPSAFEVSTLDSYVVLNPSAGNSVSTLDTYAVLRHSDNRVSTLDAYVVLKPTP